MTYIYTLPNSTAGIDDIIVQTGQTVVSFIPLILVFVWLFVFIGGFVNHLRREGNGDPSQWAALASLATCMVALLMSTKENLINLPTLSVVFGVTILTGIWYFFTKGRYDQV